MLVGVIVFPQSQVGHLDKAIKSAAQQKEQLEHEALKINRDIAEMVSACEDTHTRAHTHTHTHWIHVATLK